jgi:hypothetical protein
MNRRGNIMLQNGPVGGSGARACINVEGGTYDTV